MTTKKEDIRQAEQLLKQQLAAVGLDANASHLSMVWQAFRMFAAAPHMGDAEGFLLEKSTFNFDGKQLNWIKFFRHIVLRDDLGDQVCVEQLHMRLRDRPSGRNSTSTFYPAQGDGFRTVMKLGRWDAELSFITDSVPA